ncbi:MAG: hypothetical protein IJ088_09690 [Clostridia bacterium]|nr:hypothetical protein [Clostridia bacterium]
MNAIIDEGFDVAKLMDYSRLADPNDASQGEFVKKSSLFEVRTGRNVILPLAVECFFCFVMLVWLGSVFIFLRWLIPLLSGG